MFSAMRIRAITDHNLMLFSLVFVLLCVPVGTNLVGAVTVGPFGSLLTS